MNDQTILLKKLAVSMLVFLLLLAHAFAGVEDVVNEINAQLADGKKVAFLVVDTQLTTIEGIAQEKINTRGSA